MGQQQSQQIDGNTNNPEAAWWCKLLARVVGVIGGGLGILMGIITCIALSWNCVLGGILLIALAFVVIVMESPCCCQWLNIAKPIADFSENRPFFQKGLIYCLGAIVPAAMCFGVYTVLGCGGIFATGVLYGLMALGKKADRENMQRNAAGTPSGDGYKSNLVDNENLAGAVP